MQRSLKEIVKNIALVNNYYSNQIESEGTHPVDISRAMKKEFSSHLDQANKQRLALAYQETQNFIQNNSSELDFTLEKNIKSLHYLFYGSKNLLDEQLLIKDKQGRKYPIISGSLRELDVEAGQHLAPKPTELPRLLHDFFNHYHCNKEDLVATQLLKAFAAHHRYMFIHPFLDGNGRTGRLITDGMLKQALPESYGLWSISRGLARNNEQYKQLLARADQTRQASMDGRGLRSEKGLIEFIDFMADTSLDQIQYMKKMLNLERLHERLTKYINYSEKPIPKEFETILPHLLIFGQIKKGRLPSLLRCSERTARTVAKQLKEVNLIQDEGKFSAYKLNFSSEILSFLFPDLVPTITS
jgi:Fic family protein